MKNNRISTNARILLVACGLALAAVLFTPMWRIELNAPQYPEGLNLLIYADRLAGNVDIINGLNHYIGMKTLHTGDFIEFTLLPFIIGFFALAFITTGILGKRKWMNLLLILFICFGITAMIDFWRWEYNYGHNLDPNAAIIVPGMAYQPPLIGFKQLLNFGAYSVPDTGGWIFVGVGLVLLLMVIWEWWRNRKNAKARSLVTKTVALALLLSLNSCTPKPEPIATGKDNCSFCKMTISDGRFSCEFVTKKGKPYKFDDTHCLLAFLNTKFIEQKDIHSYYFADFNAPSNLLPSGKALLYQSTCFKGPMNGNLVAFSDAEGMKKTTTACNGSQVNWEQIKP
ncbi:MAG: nitrous oxide reductase accessory protein NosL [Chitinophagaceae bacterium]|nr:nitrous oxide reductase accessory protein NosL [Chitinophagaceae bacterium]MBL0055958.1 nitrous oxide reductase accessory protein NosL [Chitinophagaceae bacterium]